MYALTVDAWEEDGRVHVRHIFYANSEREARAVADSHIAGCDYLSAAEEDDRIGDFGERIDDDEVPTAADYDEEPDVVDAEVVEEE